MKIPKIVLGGALAAIATFLLAVSGYIYWMKVQKEKPLCPRCNIVLIDIDILRADGLPCYGYRRNTAPNLCAFGTLGQMFMNNYAQSYWTLPSMFSTITSLYPQAHGVTTLFRDTLDLKIPTLAQTLKIEGYKTLFIGAALSTISDTNGGTRGYDVVRDDVEITKWPNIILDLENAGRPFFAHFYTTRLHMPYLLENESQLMETLRRPVDFPVTQNEFSDLVGRYLYQNYKKVFTPLAISDRPDLFTNMNASDNSALLEYYWALSNAADPKRITDDGWLAKSESYIGMIKKDEQLARPYVRLLYDSVLSALDRDIAQTLLMLSSPGVAQNTIIVFYSDHGEEFGERGDYGHPDSLYNELVKTPLIIYIPGVSPQKIRGVTQNIDIFPSLLDFVGVPSPGGLQGKPFLPLVVGGSRPNSALAVSQAGPNKASIQNNVWKLIVNDFSGAHTQTELYNLIDDPEEKNNISEAHPGIKGFFLSELSKTLRLRFSP